MYHDKMLSVAKIHNGFLIEVRARYKREEEKDSKECCPSPMGYGEKEIFAKDAKDLGSKIESLMPMLETEEFESEDAFEEAFREMASK